MGIIFLLIIGALAGYVATRMTDIEAGVPLMIGIGVLGALVGGLILSTLLVIIGFAASLVGAVVGAVILIWAYQAYLEK